jgi:putative tricarboxylic transport membrane protein
VVVMIGLFALGEVSRCWRPRTRDEGEGQDPLRKCRSFRELWALRGPVVRGTGIGSMIGMIPGAGATVGAVIAYGVEKQVSPRGAEFGTGVEALTAPEAAKNATTGAAMIPLLTLGIPGSAATAIMLAALVLQGVTPGPLLFTAQPDIVYTIFASLLLANVFMIGAGVVIARASRIS